MRRYTIALASLIALSCLAGCGKGVKLGRSQKLGDFALSVKSAKYEAVEGNEKGGGWLVWVQVKNTTGSMKKLALNPADVDLQGPEDKRSNMVSVIEGAFVERTKAETMSIERMYESGKVESIELKLPAPGGTAEKGPYLATLGIKDRNVTVGVPAGKSVDVPLLFDCPKNTTPEFMSWPGLEPFRLRK